MRSVFELARMYDIDVVRMAHGGAMRDRVRVDSPADGASSPHTKKDSIIS